MAKVSRSLLCQSKLNKTVASVDDAFFHWTRLDSQLTDHTLIAVLYSLPKRRIHSLQCRNEQLAHPHKWLWQILRGNLVALRSELVSNDLRILSHVHSTGPENVSIPSCLALLHGSNVGSCYITYINHCKVYVWHSRCLVVKYLLTHLLRALSTASAEQWTLNVSWIHYSQFEALAFIELLDEVPRCLLSF